MMRRTVTFHDFCAPSPFPKAILLVLYNTFPCLSRVIAIFLKISTASPPKKSP